MPVHGLVGLTVTANPLKLAGADPSLTALAFRRWAGIAVDRYVT